MSDELFDSYTRPIPALRYDVQIMPVEQNGESFLYFYDQMGYATPDFAVPKSAESIFSLFDGRRSVRDIMRFSSKEITKEKVLGYIRFLDEHALLDSPYFKTHSELVETEYEKSKIHHTNTAGMSYPEDPEELKSFLNEAFEKLETTPPVDKARALYAPHIDLRVGLDSYVKAFSAIKNIKPKRVVILATSHYSGLYPAIYDNRPFAISDKDFHLVNGVIQADRDGIQKLKDSALNGFHNSKNGFSKVDTTSADNNNDLSTSEVFGFTFQDRAHRIEHSIELHLLFLNHLWNHEFKILPILVGGLDEIFYRENGFQGQQVDHFAKLLRQNFADDEDTFFLISGDLAHVGRKFGDPSPASEMLNAVREFDDDFLRAGKNGDTDAMLRHMKHEYDPYRICGYPPLYSFLKVLPNLKGEVLTYDVWDEMERNSAVSYGSILYE